MKANFYLNRCKMIRAVHRLGGKTRSCYVASLLNSEKEKLGGKEKKDYFLGTGVN